MERSLSRIRMDRERVKRNGCGTMGGGSLGAGAGRGPAVGNVRLDGVAQRDGLNRIHIENLARHDEYRSAGRLRRVLARRDAKCRKKRTRQWRQRKGASKSTPGRGRVTLRRRERRTSWEPQVGQAMRAASGSADSTNQRAEGPFPWNDIWNSRHDRRNSGEAVHMIVVAFEDEMLVDRAMAGLSLSGCRRRRNCTMANRPIWYCATAEW